MAARDRRRKVVQGTLVGGALLAAVCCGCTGGSRYEVVEVREMGVPAHTAGRPAMTSEQRFGFAAMAPSSDPHAGMGAHAEAAAHEPAFSFDLPEGWYEVRGGSMRQVDLRLEYSPSSECYLTVLPGTAGGASANINRWRGQMGLDAIGAADIEGLPRETLLGQEAVYVELTGEFQGMGGEAQPDSMLLGLLLEAASNTFFLKMTGPAEVLREERERFLAVGASLRPFDGEADPAPAASGSGSGGGSGSAGGLTWTAPEGWVRAGDRPMRLVTLVPEGTDQVECYVTVLAGGAGGMAANVNRWRGQMGAAPLSPAELDQLERLVVLGVESTLVEIEGHFAGMSGEEVEGAAMLGLVCPLGGQTVFVKMTGPADRVRAERARFVSFCESLQAGS